MNERLLFSEKRKEELKELIEEELLKYKEELEEQMRNTEEINNDFLRKISKKILSDEKSKISVLIDKQREFEEKTFRVHPQDLRFYYFEYLIMIFADLGEESLKFLGSKIKILDKEIIDFDENYNYTLKALAELYLQAYEIIKGILYLSKYGLGNNAMSLWRTSFEVTTIFLFLIEKDSQELSRKFLIHSIYSAEFKITREKNLEHLKRKFKKEFINKNFFKNYEWANGYVEKLEKQNITFDLLYNVQLGNFKDYYKEACSYTHPTIFRNMKRYDVSEVLIWTGCLMDKLYSFYSLYLSKLSEDKMRMYTMLMSFHLLYEEMENYIDENKK